jgi:hypothetical protein
MPKIIKNNATIYISDGLPELSLTDKPLSIDDFNGDRKMYDFYLLAKKSFQDYEKKMSEIQLIESKDDDEL